MDGPLGGDEKTAGRRLPVIYINAHDLNLSNVDRTMKTPPPPGIHMYLMVFCVLLIKDYHSGPESTECLYHGGPESTEREPQIVTSTV